MAQNYRPTDQQIGEFIQVASSNWKTPKEIYDKIIEQWWRTAAEIGDVNFDKNWNVIEKTVPVISNYDEQKAKEWEEQFNQLTNWQPDTSNDKLEDDIIEDEWANLAAAPATIQILSQALTEKVGKEWANKILKWITTKWAKWLSNILWKSAKFIWRNAWAIATWLISAYETYNDRDKWKVKAEYINGNEWAWAYLRDVWRNAYAYADNVLFWALPNIDAVYNNSKSERKAQSEALNKNKEVKKTAKELKQYTKVMDKLKWDEQNEAVRQMTNVAVNQWKQNDAAFKKQFVKENERRTMKKKDGSTYQTWVNKSTGRPVSESI